MRVSEIHELMSSQEETDTRTVIYLKYAAKLGYESAVVRTPDTDIFFILYHARHIALTIYLHVGNGKQRKVVNVSEIADRNGSEYCDMMLGVYVFTGEDATSAFKGKVGPLKKLLSNSKYHSAFR